MVDLTPPSSKHSTPLRPIDSSSDLPASPTSTAKPPLHPLAMPTGNKMDVDEATSSGSDNHFEVPDEAVEDEEEERESVEAEGGVEGDMGKVEDSGGEVIEEPGGTERSSGRARKSKGQSGRNRSWQQPKRAAQSGGQGSATAKGRKDGDLYESDIVARWNSEIGDVCLDTSTPATAITT